MYFVLTLVHIVTCVDVQVFGSVGLDIQVVPTIYERRNHAVEDDQVTRMVEFSREVTNSHPTEEIDMHDEKRLRVSDKQKVTRTPNTCRYRCPTTVQINAIISKMMNELTKLFKGVSEYVNLEANVKATRFRIVDSKQKVYFETIYSNMTNDFREFYGNYTNNTMCVRNDPCKIKNQFAIKQIWSDLLENSQKILLDASRKCIVEYMKENNVSVRSNLWPKLDKYLMRELSAIRMSQLKMLCDDHQLCYSELL